MRRADVLANDPCTREFLQAGERLLHDILARDTGEVPGEARAPFYELLAWVSRRQVSTRQRARGPGRAGRRASQPSPRSGTAGIRRPAFFATSLFIRSGHV